MKLIVRILLRISRSFTQKILYSLTVSVHSASFCGNCYVSSVLCKNPDFLLLFFVLCQQKYITRNFKRKYMKRDIRQRDCESILDFYKYYKRELLLLFCSFYNHTYIYAHASNHSSTFYITLFQYHSNIHLLSTHRQHTQQHL